MNPALHAALFVAVALLHLASRGVDARRLAAIAAATAGGSALIAALAALLPGPVGAPPIVAASYGAMICVLAAAARFACAEVLGSVTPAVVVMLNVGANMAPAAGRLPLSSAGIAAMVPLPPGAARTAIEIVILYAPAIAALVVLAGAPRPWLVLRFLLGLWVCYLGVAAAVGPGRDALAHARTEGPSGWIAATFASYAGARAAMVASNVLLAFTRGGASHALAIARSVRRDGMKAWQAAVIGAGWWGVARGLRGLDAPPEAIAAVLVAIPFLAGDALARMFARHDDVDAQARPAPWLPTIGVWTLALGIGAVGALFALRSVQPSAQSMRPGATQAPAVAARPAQGEPLRAGASGIDYYAVMVLAPRAGFTSEERDRLAAFANAAHEERFRSWLRARGIEPRTVRRHGIDFLVWSSDSATLLQDYRAHARSECIARLGATPEALRGC